MNWSLFALLFLILHPQPIQGWQVSVEPDWSLRPLPLEAAPSLPPAAHAPPERGAFLPFSADRLEAWLKSALRLCGDHLPFSFQDSFQVWVFEGVAYLAKASPGILLLADRQPAGFQQEQLIQLLAHELHHLALFSRGFPQSPQGVRDLPLALLLEGSATWMNLRSGLFPEMELNLTDAARRRQVFRLLRQVLGGRSGLEELFGRDKAGYWAGAAMVARIEEFFGAESWIAILGHPPERAAREFWQLYQRSRPPAAEALPEWGNQGERPEEIPPNQAPSRRPSRMLTTEGKTATAWGS